MSTSFQDKLTKRQAGILTYGLTPPKLGTPEDKLTQLGRTQSSRLSSIPGLDAVVVYDIQDEKDRNPNPRPFPFMDTIDGVMYCEKYLCLPRTLPAIVYRCTAKYTAQEFESFLAPNPSPAMGAAVFVGASARGQAVHLSMREAYDIKKRVGGALPIGGVAIPERHATNGDEHTRIIAKQADGCRFFVTQCVYNVEAAKEFLSDYFYGCKDAGVPMVPIIVTLTPCGSKKTLQFMEWLGIRVSRWLKNDLLRAGDSEILAESVDACETMFRDLWQFCEGKGIPLGCNVESVAVRRAEIDASVELVRRVKRIMGQRENIPVSKSFDDNDASLLTQDSM